MADINIGYEDIVNTQVRLPEILSKLTLKLHLYLGSIKI